MKGLRKILATPLQKACRQLEISGYCPHAPNNKLDKYCNGCQKFLDNGVFGCHDCIAESFSEDNK